jgi:hypothetical protein
MGRDQGYKLLLSFLGELYKTCCLCPAGLVRYGNGKEV